MRGMNLGAIAPSHELARIALFLVIPLLLVALWRAPCPALLAVHEPLSSLGAALAADLGALRPQCVHLLRAGELRVQDELTAVVEAAGVSLQLHEDPTFLITPAAFGDWLGTRRQPRMEHFYRFMRRRSGVLMDGDQPSGGAWNFDARNRRSFDRNGPGLLPAPAATLDSEWRGSEADRELAANDSETLRFGCESTAAATSAPRLASARSRSDRQVSSTKSISASVSCTDSW